MLYILKEKKIYELGLKIYPVLFAKLDNYKEFIFYPILSVLIFLITAILITALFYYLFQYEKKPKKSNIKEVELSKGLIPK